MATIQVNTVIIDKNGSKAKMLLHETSKHEDLRCYIILSIFILCMKIAYNGIPVIDVTIKLCPSINPITSIFKTELYVYKQ